MSIGGLSAGARPGCYGSLGPNTDLIGEAAHERFAQRKLVERNPFVGLVRLLDVARTADDGCDSGVVKQRCFGAEGDLAVLVRAAARTAKLGNFVSSVRIEAG